MNYKELSNTFKKINKWYGKKTKVLSIKTRPFNTVEIFSNIINKVVGRESNIPVSYTHLTLPTKA